MSEDHNEMDQYYKRQNKYAESEDNKDYDKLGIGVPKGWRFYEHDVKTNKMIIKRTKNMASLKWEEGGYLTGYYVSIDGAVFDTQEEGERHPREDCNVNIFKTSKQAYAANALAMLSQQLDRANEGWKPGDDVDKDIYSISCPNEVNNNFLVSFDPHSRRFLSFKKKGVAEEFLKTNMELIKQASVFLI